MARPPLRGHPGGRPTLHESLGDHWGDLCATTELASAWADQLLPNLRSVLRERKRGIYAFFPGTTLCYSALFKAGRRAEAFDNYALLANQANSNLSTFRALARKYPELAPDKLLDHLIASTPGEPGKWFATAKTLKRFDKATQLAWTSPCDPKTLTRAARDHLTEQPNFAMQAALAALHWMSMGHGYELTGLDAHEAHRLALDGAKACHQTDQAQATIEHALGPDRAMSVWLRQALGLPIAATATKRH